MGNVMMKIELFLGALMGFMAMLLSASVDHMLAGKLGPQALHSLQTAIHYQKYYALLIVLMSICLPATNAQLQKSLVIALRLFCLGSILFAAGIYLSLSFQMSMFVYLTPIGGVILILGWISLIIAAITSRNDKVNQLSY